MQKIYFLLLSFLLLFFINKYSYSQSVLSPYDSIVEYNPANPPQQPDSGQIGKWVRTRIFNWSDSFKAYIYNGNAFRLRFPKNYDTSAANTKKYPLMIMFHGEGEDGPITDNELQLTHFGKQAEDAIEKGIYDGYVLFMQTPTLWGRSQFLALRDIIDYMTLHNKIDPFRVNIHGLSAGGRGAWRMLTGNPTYIASCLPMSAASVDFVDKQSVDLIKFTPIWNFQGGLDDNPTPSAAKQVRNIMLAAGANYRYTEYPNLAHGTWNTAYNEDDFWPFMLRAYQANPWPLFGRTEFCPNEAINVTIGLTPGFQAYEWRKDGVLIPNATGNIIQVTTIGTYDARIMKNGIWSDWSHIPVVIKIKGPTITPPIRVSGLMSSVLPAPDGKDYVNLEIPDSGYTSYRWKKVGQNIIIGTERILTVTQPGMYTVTAQEKYGCSTVPSPVFTVASASGANAPDPATNVVASTISNSEIELDWSNKPNPLYNETAFEIYRAVKPGGPYTLIALVPTDTTTYSDQNLNANTKYFYVIRAVNNNGAAPLSPEVFAITAADKSSPSAPGNLRLVTASDNSIVVEWDSSFDDLGIKHYEVFMNGKKIYTTTQTSVIVNALQPQQQYVFSVRAVDASGNYSNMSNQLAAITQMQGLHYKYYEGEWYSLPDFTKLKPQTEGVSKNIDTSIRRRTNRYGILWEGFIRIPVSGTYTFQTSSDDGSKLWLQYYNPSAQPLVNNDGLHLAKTASGTVTLTAGIYPISIAYFQSAQTSGMKLYWACKELFNDTLPHKIADMYFRDTAKALHPTVPAKPANLIATAISNDKIMLSWSDKSDNETGFEIYRSRNAGGPYNIIATTSANTTKYSDSLLAASTEYFYKIQAINNSGSSGFVTQGGLVYSYYEGTWKALPPFDSLQEIKTGRVNNITLDSAQKNVGYAFTFGGVITIPASGQYHFYLNSDDGSKLYIDGFAEENLVVNNDKVHLAKEKSKWINLFEGDHPFYVSYFQKNKTASLQVSYDGPGISKTLIPDSAFKNTPAVAFARTSTPPALPVAASGLIAQALSPNKIALKWQDNSSDETSFVIYRSLGDTTKFKPLAYLAPNVTSYSDTSLFGNIIYYYKVMAVNEGGSSSSAIASAKTTNTLPVITPFNNVTVRYSTSNTFTVIAQDADGDNLTYSLANAPAFATITTNANKTASLILNPSQSDQGVYTNVKVIVNDGNGGKDSTIFSITVNDNYIPVIDSIPDYTVTEGDILNIPLAATDQNTGDVINWNLSTLPVIYSINRTSNLAATLVLKPGYSSSNTYLVSVYANDGKGGTAVRQFNLTVLNKDPNNSIYVRFKDMNVTGAPWNSITQTVTNNLYDEQNKQTQVGLSLLTNWFSVGHEGPLTGNNSGIYADSVLQDYYYFGRNGGPDSVSAKITGLDTSRRYRLTFYGGSVWSGTADNGTTVYSVDTQKVSLYVQNNTQNVAVITNIKPDASGNITFKMTKGSNSPAGYINALVITTLYDDKTLPFAPTNLTANDTTRYAVKLSWIDNAYNEQGYQIFRSTSLNGPYTIIGKTYANARSYNDSNYTGNTTYYYRVNAFNQYGTSRFSQTISITTSNRIPRVNPITNIILKNNQTASIQVTGIDDSIDHITLRASNLPTFVTFKDNGNGTGTLNMQPSSTSIGYYPAVTITASDGKDSSSAGFDISVVDQFVNSVYLNFSNGSSGPQPWNNLIGSTAAGTVYSNFNNDSYQPSNISVTLVDSFLAVGETGMKPGNGKSVYPEVVMRTGLYDSSSKTKTIKVSGLTAGKKYNFIFFNSHDDGTNGLTHFTINGKTVSLNASYNTDKIVQINGVDPDVNGSVCISIAKDTAAEYSYLNAMVIQSYDNTIPLLSPTDIRAVEVTKSTATLEWSDRSYNETGFELWRSTNGGAYQRVAVLAPDVTSHTDSSLAPNTTYFYVVRAVKSGIYSNYSNIARVTTYAYSVYINFNYTNPAPFPWNNTSTLPQAGYVWRNFADDNRIPTNIGMVQTSEFDGFYGAGMNTNNNSGIYPDNVIMSNYGLFTGSIATIKITGLEDSVKYNFTFFASSQAIGDVNTAYTINGKTVVLNASQNISGTVTLYDVVADENGEANITITSATPTSQFGLIGALVISSYNASNAIAPVPVNTRLLITNNSGSKAEQIALKNDKKEDDGVLLAYPNPFRESFVLKVPAKANEKVVILISDMSGKIVYRNDVSNTIEGDNYFTIRSNQNLSLPGLYLIKVVYVNRNTSKMFKIEKNR